MKKYKLIKELPFENSPKIGYISKSHTLREDSVHYYNGNWFYPDNYPEFWQEVVEKDYEILTFYNKEGNDYFNLITPKNGDCYYHSAPVSNRTLKYCLKFYQIHSVKRLSDGEVFTIGDEIETDNVLPFKITSFRILSTGILIADYIGFSIWRKVKKPLFTTEDGVDIFEGDIYIALLSNYDLTQEKAGFNHDNIYCHCLKFSTKEKAEEYVIMNKPCLSLNDVAKVYVSAGFEITNRNKKHPYIKQQLQLRELIKTKLKKAL